MFNKTFILEKKMKIVFLDAKSVGDDIDLTKYEKET